MRVIDLFAGAGGFTVGAELAGCEVVWAANHWQVAVNTHEANHRNVINVCQDLHQADWSQVPVHDLMLASPSCQGHSNARGKERAQHDASRATAWAVVSAAEYHRPQFAIVENVPEFRNWTLFPAWLQAMEALGYCMKSHIIDAADHGVPQHRTRLFIVCSLRKQINLNLPKREHRPATDFIDWLSGNWSEINKPGRATATLKRIARGRADHGNRFLAPYYSAGSGLTGRSVNRPVGTITTKARWSLIDGHLMRMLTVDEQRKAMGFPSGYHLPPQNHKAVHLLGNAVVPRVATDLINALKKAA